MTRTLTLALAAAGLALPGIAHACGGFFCNQSEPVDQAGEEILFAVDGETGKTEMHVKVEYEGPASEFSWVVPVGGIPELGVGTAVLFDLLRGYGSQWYLDREYEGDCWDNYWGTGTGGTGTGTGTGGGYYSTSSSAGGVVIVDSGVVGPYETVTLTATDTGALVSWLENNNYDIPPGFDAVIAPYVAGGSHFVGLKLTKDADTGDLAPLVLTYDSTTPSIPIQLTSIAATPDMPLAVYVLGDYRAVPESYLHIQLNHLAIDWWRTSWEYETVDWDNVDWDTFGLRLDEAIRDATNEAGGHGFITDYSGSPGSIVGSLVGSQWDVTALEQSPNAFEFMSEIIQQGWPADGTLLEILNTHIPVPVGFNETDFYNNPWLYEDEYLAIPFDSVAAAADMDAKIYQPRQNAEDLLSQHAVITRMTSTLSPAEMTVDPVFVFNPDMPLRPINRVATEVYVCSDGYDYYDAPRELELEDGRVVLLPSRQYLNNLGITEYEYMAEITSPAAAIIERTGASGLPEVLIDNTDEMYEDVNRWNLDQIVGGTWTGHRPGDDLLLDGTDGEARGGCGCTTSPGGVPAGLLLVLGGLALARRRER